MLPRRLGRLAIEQPLIIWWAIFTHLAWGLAILWSPPISRIGILVGIDRFVDAGIPARGIGSALVFVAILAAVALTMDTYHLLSKGASMILLAPQYFLLLSALFTDLQTIAVGELRNQHIDRAILIAVLGPIIIAAILHTVAIIERYSRWTTYAR